MQPNQSTVAQLIIATWKLLATTTSAQCIAPAATDASKKRAIIASALESSDISGWRLTSKTTCAREYFKGLDLFVCSSWTVAASALRADHVSW